MAPAETMHKPLLGAAVIILLVLLAYLPAMNAGFIWDDDDYVINNRTIRDVDGLGNIWFKLGATPQYYPLVFTTFWIEYHLWELHPAGYHIVNIVLHALGAVLLWIVLRRLAVPGAWLAAAIFAVHPVHVESVAWITERKNVLSGVFYMAALLAYFRFASIESINSPRGNEHQNWRFYALAILLFVCALLSKTVTCSLPAVILLILWWKRERVGSRDILPLIPLFILGAALGLTTAWLEKHHVGAEGDEWSATLLERCLIAGRVLWFYAAKLIWPTNLTFIYPRWQINSRIWWQYLYPMAAIATVFILWLQRMRIGKGPLVAVLFFVGTLTPALGFFDVYPMRYSFVADHFQYLASIGPILLFAALLVTALKAFRPPSRKPQATSVHAASSRLAFLPAALVLGILVTLTWRQTYAYKDLESLWTDTVRKNPQSWLAHNNLGHALANQDRNAEAYHHLTEALRIKPDYAEGHSNLAAMLARQGKLDEAITHGREAVRYAPESVAAHVNLANALAGTARLDEALSHYKEAIRLGLPHPPLYNNIGKVLAAQGKLDEAVGAYAQSLRLDPNYREARYNLAVAFGRQGKLDESIEQFKLAIQGDPTSAEAREGLGMVWELKSMPHLAIAEYQEALRLNPQNPNLKNRLEKLLVRQSQAK